MSDRLPGQADSGAQPDRRLERICSALIEALRAGSLGDSVHDELTRAVGNSVRQISAGLQQELDLISAATTHLGKLAHVRFLARTELADHLLADLSQKRSAMVRLVEAFEQFDDGRRTRGESVLADLPDGEQTRQPSDPPKNTASQTKLLAEPARADSPTALIQANELNSNRPFEVDAEPNAAKEILEYCRQAEERRREGNLIEAEELLNGAIDLDPENSDLFARRGLIYLLAGESDYAIEDFTLAIEASGGNSELHSLRGDAHARAGRLNEAVTDYRAALAFQPDMPKTRFNLGLALRKLGSWSGALAEFSRVITADPGHAPSYFQRGLIRLEHSTPAEAIADFRAVLRNRPDFVQAREKLAIALQLLGHNSPDALTPRHDRVPKSENAVPKRGASSTKSLPIQCPVCGSAGLLNWDRLDKIVVCQKCKRAFGVRPDGKTVEVVRASNGAWVELAVTLEQQSKRRMNRRGWLALTTASLGLLSLGFWRATRAPDESKTAELPKDLKSRADLFARAWLRNDVPLMRRLTSPSHEKLLYSWYVRHRPPLPRSEGIRANLPESVRSSIQVSGSAPDRSRVVIRLEGLHSLGGGDKPVELALEWRDQEGTWYFQVPTSRQ